MILKVAVIGSGQMGSGIAQLIAQAEIKVVNIDICEKQTGIAKVNIAKSLDKLVMKGKFTEEKRQMILSCLSFSNSYDDASDADMIIEAVPEKIDLKKKVFQELNEIIKENAVVVSNTSGLSISEMGSVLKKPENFMGMHFFYPAPVMKLVELIKGLATSDETYRIVYDFSIAIGKEPVNAPELPGFLVNRILVPMMNEGAFCVMEGAKPEDVDKAMKLGANLPMGPLELADFVGLDVMLATMTGLYEGFKDSKYRPCPLIVNLVKAGRLGRKTGRGFYEYTK